ncbi:MAG: beta-galactosidase trimerization domain-containing protein, partial [Kiritimatiellae bacterium]|nr:beta-galactosidase trimerization domain-containing protein [Kiritimatiellia bacterium]
MKRGAAAVALAALAAVPGRAADSFSIAPDGNFLVGGKSKYLIGTIIYHQPAAKDYRHTEGYDAADAWIYETPPNREYLDRLGFDSVGGEVSLTWLNEFRPDAKVWQARKALDWNIATNWWLSGLPTIVDFTCARWSHGAIKFEEGREPPREALPEGGAGHFMPYSLVTPSGRALYARMWRAGAEELKAHGAAPYAYELFNEPTFEEISPASRAAFARHLRETFAGDVSAMDAAFGSNYGSFDAAADFRHPNERPGLGVEWLKFRERVFASGIRLGAETIRGVVPDARVCFQPSGAFFGWVNILRANRECAVVMAPTGGGTAFDALLLRAVADGKPIIDGETYLGHTRASHRAKPLLHYARGLNASYYFKWDRRLDDPRFSGPDGPDRMAETFPYVALNPAATKAEAFEGLRDARREISFVEDVMNPRERGVPRSERAAFLFSMPTERLGAAAGHGNHNFTRASAEALMAAHVPVDAVFEEQLSERRLDGYRFLVASGIDATCRGTVRALLDWVSRGGSLVVGQEALELDEWGNRRAPDETLGIALGERIPGEPRKFALGGVEYEGAPYRAIAAAEGWSVVSALPDGTPAVLERRVGDGRIRFVAVRLSDAEEARLLADLAAEAGILPSCSATDFESGESVGGLEIHAGRGDGGDTAFILALHGLAPRAVRFTPGDGFQSASLVDAADGRA